MLGFLGRTGRKSEGTALEVRDTPGRARGVGVIDAASAVEGATRCLLSIQKPDGEWCAQLEGDTILESEWALTMWFLGRQGEPRVAKAAETIRRHQRPGGAWAIYPDGPVEISASVKAYFVLKLMGDDPSAPHMVRAREAIHREGGVEATNSYTKVMLSVFGQYDWTHCPAIPPEMILFPPWFPFTIYEMSSWARAIVVPLSIVWAMRPHCTIPENTGIAELYTEDGVAPDITKFTGLRNWWTRFFALTDTILKIFEHSPVKPLRRLALERCEAWIRARLVKSDGVAAIIPPIIFTIIGFKALGYTDDDPIVRSQILELEKLEIEQPETLQVQPCFSALWDTAQVMNVLLASGAASSDERLLHGARWLLDHEVREIGDWAKKVKGVDPGGWYFEYANEWYPDCDDTAEVLMVLAQVRFPDAEEDALRKAAMGRGLTWLLAMQNRDGGWAAFDRDCHHTFLTHVPFADHNAMLDPSCEDITGRVLDALSMLGFDRMHGAVRRGMRFLKAKQLPDGTWYGRWGNNYIYGTWLALTGLHAMDPHTKAGRTRRAARWLLAHQNEDGGWGESLRTYDEPESKGLGESTAAQTAWALLALFAAGDHDSDAVRRGVSYLIATQRRDGSWHDVPWTGTGFPRVFYLRYHLYATQFPLLALAQYRDLNRKASDDAA